MQTPLAIHLQRVAAAPGLWLMPRGVDTKALVVEQSPLQNGYNRDALNRIALLVV